MQLMCGSVPNCCRNPRTNRPRRLRLSSESISITQDQELLQRCYQQGIKLLVPREHSVLELQRKLIQRGYSSGTIANTLARLQQEGLLDQTRFCEAYASSRYSKGYGPVRIGQELNERGVDRFTVQQILSRGEFDWFERAVQTYEKRFGAVRADVDRKQQSKRQRFLLYRGFTHEQIAAAMGST